MIDIVGNITHSANGIERTADGSCLRHIGDVLDYTKGQGNLTQIECEPHQVAHSRHW